MHSVETFPLLSSSGNLYASTGTSHYLMCRLRGRNSYRVNNRIISVKFKGLRMDIMSIGIRRIFLMAFRTGLIVVLSWDDMAGRLTGVPPSVSTHPSPLFSLCACDPPPKQSPASTNTMHLNHYRDILLPSALAFYTNSR